MLKNTPANARDFKRGGFDPWVGNNPLEEGTATHCSILACHGQRNLAGYSPWSGRVGDMTEVI